MLVFQLMEPIPAMDSFVEMDWRINSEMVGDVKAVRVLSGYESPEGKLDPQQARGFWFDANGNLLKTYFSGVETLRSDFENFQNVHVARRIDVFHDSTAVMHIRISEISGAEDALPKNVFEIKGHEVSKEYSSEAR
jgi:hypothetical protein